MRWLWVDQFTEFVSGRHAAGVKNISLAEEAVDEYCTGYPMLPPTLIIEGMAQLGGILVAEHFCWDKRVVLAKIGKAVFHDPPRAGDQLRYRVDLDSSGDGGATVTATSHWEGKLQAEVELMFAFLEGDRYPEQSLFQPGDLESMMRIMRMFDVAVDGVGQPLSIPFEKL
ncbi:MAG: 3-hydroxyacyl-ACP dehydratase FabZ family protein [Planctomycetota bacterium]